MFVNEIRAFVGHSFTSNDTPIVEKFLKIFAQLSNMLPYFTWTHAEAAEPKEVGAKVLRILADKNVFIGICTKKERVIADSDLTPQLFSPAYLKGHQSKFGWKTSDWIIQEIGLAIGRELNLILLVEKDVQRPGGLQGNVEYIEFERDAPERVFGKILEMITALSPKVPGTAVEHVSKSSEPSAGKAEPQPSDSSDWTTPKTSWGRDDYELAYFHKIVLHDEEGASAIDEAYRATTNASEGNNLSSWQAHNESTKLEFGEGGSLPALESLAKAHPDNGMVLYYLARGYQHFGNYAKAAIAFEAAAQQEKTDVAKAIRHLGRAALAHAQDGQMSLEADLVAKIRTRLKETGEGEIDFLHAILSLAELRNEDYVELGVRERIVEIEPSDISARFSLAYKHSNCGNPDLAFLHYLKIPFGKRDQITWNNLGVEFDKFSMPAKSVAAYRRAEAKGETLAMSNLAWKLMAAGFIPEAQKLCDAAILIHDYHKNVGQTIARIKNIDEEEDAKQTDQLKGAEPKYGFFREFGRAIVKPAPPNVEEFWHGPRYTLRVSISGATFEASGEYEIENSLLISVSLSDTSTTKSRRKIKYKGLIRGGTIDCVVTRSEPSGSSASYSILSSASDEIRGLIILPQDGGEVKVMELSKNSTPSFYSFKRKEFEEGHS